MTEEPLTVALDKKYEWSIFGFTQNNRYEMIANFESETILPNEALLEFVNTGKGIIQGKPYQMQHNSHLLVFDEVENIWEYELKLEPRVEIVQ